MLLTRGFDEDGQVEAEKQRVYQHAGDYDVRYDGLAADGGRQIGIKSGIEHPQEVCVFLD